MTTGVYANKLAFTDKVEEVFGCAVCQFATNRPVTTVCGHNFCRDCLGAIAKNDKKVPCPHCRR